MAYSQKQASIFCIGQAVVDFVMTLDTLPNRPEKYRANQAAIVGGGCAANAAAAIARLGGLATIGARLGADEIGDLILRGLAEEGVDCSHARLFPNARSSFSNILVNAAGERQIVNFRDPAMPEDAVWLERAIPDTVDAVLADTRWGAGALVGMEKARALGRPGVMDAEAPIAVACDALEAASHIIFSAQGLRDFSDTDDISIGLAAAQNRFGGFVAVTDGPKGVLWRDGETMRHEPAFPVDVVDTLAAGDVWHGAFALALGEGQDMNTALRFANAAASLKCTKAGGREGTPSRAETDVFLTRV